MLYLICFILHINITTEIHIYLFGYCISHIYLGYMNLWDTENNNQNTLETTGLMEETHMWAKAVATGRAVHGNSSESCVTMGTWKNNCLPLTGNQTQTSQKPTFRRLFQRETNCSKLIWVGAGERDRQAHQPRPQLRWSHSGGRCCGVVG